MFNIFPEEYHLPVDSVAVYTLGNMDDYCKNIINQQTGIIDQYSLNTAFDIIGKKFKELYKLYIKTSKEQNDKNE